MRTGEEVFDESALIDIIHRNQEIVQVFTWARDMEVMTEWFVLLLKLGANPLIPNHRI